MKRRGGSHGLGQTVTERVLLPPGEGGAKRRMRAGMRKGFGIPALTRRFAAPSPGGRGTSLHRYDRDTGRVCFADEVFTINH